jgi:hypothetical protein
MAKGETAIQAMKSAVCRPAWSAARKEFSPVIKKLGMSDAASERVDA